MNASLDDYRWLTGPDAATWLAEYQAVVPPSVAQVRRLRRALTATRAHLILEQCELRRRATAKFEAAASMYFTRQGLEQATDEGIAHFKAQRFPAGQAVADLCCGIGGDLLGLARRAAVTGVDLNPIHTLLSEANARASGLASCSFATEDASTWPVERCAAWHLDPDRRVQGERTAQMAFSRPSVDAIDRLLAACPQAALKLAPAADVPDTWAQSAERQWIGSGRECRQQVVWFAALAQHPACRSAVVVDRHGQAGQPVVGRNEVRCDVASAVGRYVYEPHPCIIAARLAHTLGARYGLAVIDPQVAYFTGDQPIADLRLATFTVMDVLPFDLRQLRSVVRERRIGNLEVKKRAVDADPTAVRRQLQGRGEESAVLILTPHAGAVRAILAARC
jgi:hypothetical protein